MVKSREYSAIVAHPAGRYPLALFVAYVGMYNSHTKTVTPELNSKQVDENIALIKDWIANNPQCGR